MIFQNKLSFKMYKSIFEQEELDEIIEGKIYLASLKGAKNTELLENLGITHIISILNSKPKLKIPKTVKDIYFFKIKDGDENIYKIFSEVSEIITKALDEGGKVLVHCRAGVSRSASVVTAYLMNCGFTKEEAFQIIRSKRYIKYHLLVEIALDLYAEGFYVS